MKASSVHYLFSGIIFFLVISSFLSFIDKKEIIIFLVGDSTVANKPYSVGNPEKGWGQVFPLYFKAGISIENHAANGRSTKSFRDEGRWDIVLDRMNSGDYVIIEFGHNDQKSHDSTRYAAPETDYRQNLIRFIEEAKSRGGLPILATPIVRRRFDKDDVFYDTHGKYPEVVREVANKLNTPLLDLHALSKNVVMQFGPERSKMLFLHIEPGEYPTLSEAKVDDTHLSGTGAFKICDLVMEELGREVPALKIYFKD